MSDTPRGDVSTGRAASGEAQSSGPSRRAFVVAGGAVAALAGGWFFFRRTTEGPDDVAVEFVAALDAGDFSAADERIHPESPLEGAGDAADLLAAVAGVDGVIDALDVTVVETEIVEDSDGQAVVDVTVDIDLVVETVTVDIPLAMRTHDGDWFVWNVAV